MTSQLDLIALVRAEYQAMAAHVDRINQIGEQLFAGFDCVPKLALDGNIIGSYAELLGCMAFGLTPQRASTAGCDAVDGRDRRVEIKATHRGSIALRQHAVTHGLLLLAFFVRPDGGLDLHYNGEATQVWEFAKTKRGPNGTRVARSTKSNGQVSITLRNLARLQLRITAGDPQLPKPSAALRAAIFD